MKRTPPVTRSKTLKGRAARVAGEEAWRTPCPSASRAGAAASSASSLAGTPASSPSAHTGVTKLPSHVRDSKIKNSKIPPAFNPKLDDTIELKSDRNTNQHSDISITGNTLNTSNCSLDDNLESRDQNTSQHSSISTTDNTLTTSICSLDDNLNSRNDPQQENIQAVGIPQNAWSVGGISCGKDQHLVKVPSHKEIQLVSDGMHNGGTKESPKRPDSMSSVILCAFDLPSVTSSAFDLPSLNPRRNSYHGKPVEHTSIGGGLTLGHQKRNSLDLLCDAAFHVGSSSPNAFHVGFSSPNDKISDKTVHSVQNIFTGERKHCSPEHSVEYNTALNESTAIEDGSQPLATSTPKEINTAAKIDRSQPPTTLKLNVSTTAVTIDGPRPTSTPTSNANTTANTMDRPQPPTAVTSCIIPVAPTERATPCDINIRKSERHIILRDRKYPEDHTGEFVLLLDARGDQCPTERDVGKALMRHDNMESAADSAIPEYEFKKIGRQRYTICTEDRKLFENVQKIPLIISKFEMSVPSGPTEYIGVAKVEPDFLEVIEDNLHDCNNINAVYFMCKRNGEKLEKTNFVKIHFIKQVTSVKIGFLKYKISKYIPKIKCCFQCCRYGHLSRVCKAGYRCMKCGNTQQRHTCNPQTVGCLACNKPDHLFGSKSCPILQYLMPYGYDLHKRKIMIAELLTRYRKPSRANKYDRIQPRASTSPMHRANYKSKKEADPSSACQPRPTPWSKRLDGCYYREQDFPELPIIGNENPLLSSKSVSDYNQKFDLNKLLSNVFNTVNLILKLITLNEGNKFIVPNDLLEQLQTLTQSLQTNIYDGRN